MIWTILLNGIITVFNALTLTLLPVITELPFGVDEYLVTGVGYLNFLKVVFPPIELMWEAFLIVIGFKLLLKLFAMIPILRHMLHK